MDNTVRYFQWITLERKGEIMIYDKIVSEDGIIYICFKDGSRINEDLVAGINITDMTGKMMAEISSPKNAWKFEENIVGREEEKWEQNEAGEQVCVQPFVPGRRTFKLIPPQRTAPSTSNFGTIDQSSIKPNETILNDNITAQTSPKNVTGTSKSTQLDPVYIMLSKSKKIDQTVEMELNISLPSIPLFDVIKESFEDGSEKLLEYIIQDIDVECIKEAIKNSLRLMYNTSQKINDNNEQADTN